MHQINKKRNYEIDMDDNDFDGSMYAYGQQLYTEETIMLTKICRDKSNALSKITFCKK